MFETNSSELLLQSQRQLQLSLEAHGRYITSLIEREGLQHKMLPHLMAVGPSLAQSVPGLAALTAQRQPSASAPLLGLAQPTGHLQHAQGSDQQQLHMPHSLSGAAPVQTGQTGQTSDQQTHFMPLSGSGASDFAPHGLLGTGTMLHLGAGHIQLGRSPAPNASHAGPSSDVSPSTLSRQIPLLGTNPFALISKNGYGADDGSPGLLLNTDLQAAAAAWDDRQHCILPRPSNPLVELPASLPLTSPYTMPMTSMEGVVHHDWGLPLKDPAVSS